MCLWNFNNLKVGTGPKKAPVLSGPGPAAASSRYGAPCNSVRPLSVGGFGGRLFDVGPAAVLPGDLRHRQRPDDADAGVVVAQAARGFRRIGGRDEIVHLAIVLERLEAMGEAGRTPHHAVILRRQLGAEPLVLRG